MPVLNGVSPDHVASHQKFVPISIFTPAVPELLEELLELEEDELLELDEEDELELLPPDSPPSVVSAIDARLTNVSSLEYHSQPCALPFA